ncbi:MAG: hypothetical protein KA310_03545 [Pseudomonadales bacterium]|nr:hypothetical protein [Pseudomonadales bacterium]
MGKTSVREALRKDGFTNGRHHMDHLEDDDLVEAAARPGANAEKVARGIIDAPDQLDAMAEHIEQFIADDGEPQHWSEGKFDPADMLTAYRDGYIAGLKARIERAQTRTR